MSSLCSSSKSLAYLLVALCLIQTSVDAATKPKRKLKLCKIDYVVECLGEMNNYFTAQQNGTGIPSNEEEMDQFCFNLHDFSNLCVKQYLARCATNVHADVITRLVMEPLRTSVRRFCDPKGPIRPVFLRNSKCLISEVKLSNDYRRNCVKPLQASNEFIFENAYRRNDVAGFLRNFCCSFYHWEDCIVNELNINCGKEAGDVFPHLIQSASFEILKGLCPRPAFEPNNPLTCDRSQFMAPKNIIPKGISSNSIVSYYFTYMCPNVGFGIGNDIIPNK